MNDYIKIFIVALIASLVGGLAVVTFAPEPVFNTAGITNYDQIDAADGFSVDETIVIDGNGNVDAPITSTTGTFSSTLGVTGILTADGESLMSLLTKGGATTSSTTAASMTLSAADVCDNSLLEITPTVGSITMTFPTAALLIADCIPNIGDERKFWMQNASTTGTAIITIADGANCIHVEGEGLTTLIDNNEWAEITMMNVDATRCMLDVEIRQDAD